MTRALTGGLLLLAAASSCNRPVALPVETELALINLSPHWYASIGLRPAGGAEDSTDFFQSDLIPPFGVSRQRFLDVLPATAGCPDRLHVRVHLYRRLHADLPPGQDPGEPVDPHAIASGQADVAACATVIASSFTIVILDTPEGAAALRVAEGTQAERVVQFTGANLPELDVLPPRLATAALAGRVLSPDWTPLENIGVLLRPSPTLDDPDRCPDQPVGVCMGPPIAFTKTDLGGRFSFDRPPGVYQVEPFADGFLFRPGFIAVASPIDNILFFAEPLP